MANRNTPALRLSAVCGERLSPNRADITGHGSEVEVRCSPLWDGPPPSAGWIRHRACPAIPGRSGHPASSLSKLDYSQPYPAQSPRPSRKGMRVISRRPLLVPSIGVKPTDVGETHGNGFANIGFPTPEGSNGVERRAFPDRQAGCAHSVSAKGVSFLIQQSPHSS